MPVFHLQKLCDLSRLGCDLSFGILKAPHENLIWSKWWKSVFYLSLPHPLSFPGGSDSKECRRPGFDPWVGTISWRRAWQPTLVFLPGEPPWTEEHGEIQCLELQRVRHDWVTKHPVTYVEQQSEARIRCYSYCPGEFHVVSGPWRWKERLQLPRLPVRCSDSDLHLNAFSGCLGPTS